MLTMDPKKIIQGLYTGLNIADAYQKGGCSALTPEVALSAFFDRRFSDASTLNATIFSHLYLSRKDFPALAEREEVTFLSGSNYLAGYLYRASLSRGLVLYVHGMNGMADDLYSIGQNYFLTHGYDVFAIDLTASGRSEGHGVPGLHQSALDVSAAIAYVTSRYDLMSQPLYLFGHSWGAYGVCASLHFPSSVRAVAALSGFDTPLKEMAAVPAARVGFPMALPTEGLDEPLRIRAGANYNLSASKSIASSGVPTLLIHGAKDSTVPLQGASTYEATEAPNATKLLCPDKGHMDIFYDSTSIAYANQVKDMARELTERYGKLVSNVPQDEWNAFLNRFDPRMTSVLDENLFGKIDSFFASH